ncbi:hypothetical protein GCM10027610_035420 [Dactylosporangium cerinum]
MTPPLLSIDGLTIHAPTRHGPVSLVEEVSLQVRPGETVCLIGESGSGKTVTAKAIMRLTDFDGLQITAGKVVIDGHDVTRLAQRDLRQIRGRKVAMVFQEPSPPSIRCSPSAPSSPRPRATGTTGSAGNTRSACSTASASRTRSCACGNCRVSSPAGCCSG